MKITENTTISEILSQNRQTNHVFQTFGIDYEHNNSRTLCEVCEIRFIELSVLIECLNIVDLESGPEEKSPIRMN